MYEDGRILLIEMSKHIGIIHIFHVLTFAIAKGSSFNLRLPGIKMPPRDTANVNVMKRVIAILAFCCDSNENLALLTSTNQYKFFICGHFGTCKALTLFQENLNFMIRT